MRIFKPLAKAVAAETAEAIGPRLDRVSSSVDALRTDLEAVRKGLESLLAVVERVETERPGWLAGQTLSSLERDLATFSHRNGTERKTR